MKAKQLTTIDLTTQDPLGAKVKILNKQLIKMASLINPSLGVKADKKHNGLTEQGISSSQQSASLAPLKEHQKKTHQQGPTRQSIPIKA